MQYFDSHCHLQFPQYDSDRGEVLARMEELGVGGVVVGTDLATSKAALELAQKHDFLWASVGLHPNEKEEWFDISNQMAELAIDSKVAAIGECGLDYFRSGGTPEEKALQKSRFEAQIGLALNLKKTLIVHCRNAHDDMFAVLSSYSHELESKKVGVVMHFFTGTGELAQKYLDLGCYLSFPGPITYTDMYDDSIRIAPLDKILIETDAPFAAPVPHRGSRNEPAYVANVLSKVVQVKNLEEEKVRAAIIKNTQEAFKI